MSGVVIPSVYREGYARARELNPEPATKYLKYVTVGDPPADAAVEALAPLNQAGMHRFINAGMEDDKRTLADAPEALQEFFQRAAVRPDWFDIDGVQPGCRAFHTYSDLFIPAFFVVTLRNAATLISKAFYMTGRVLSEGGYRRIRQNTRHFIEIMLPGALERHGEGWKLSVRIRLVHAQVRHLLRTEGDWDESRYGVPLSSAHMGIASANFSAGMLRQADRLGARLLAEQRSSFMQIWRYASYLIGTPEELLFAGDEAATNELYRVGRECEPPPGDESAAIANALIKALPRIAGLEKQAARRAMVAHTYRVSRALLGHDVADRLQFPRQSTAGLLPWMRLKRRAYSRFYRLAPNYARRLRGKNFEFLLNASMLSDLSYKLPDHLKAEMASPW